MTQTFDLDYKQFTCNLVEWIAFGDLYQSNYMRKDFWNRSRTVSVSCLNYQRKRQPPSTSCYVSHQLPTVSPASKCHNLCYYIVLDFSRQTAAWDSAKLTQSCTSVLIWSHSSHKTDFAFNAFHFNGSFVRAEELCAINHETIIIKIDWWHLLVFKHLLRCLVSLSSQTAPFKILLIRLLVHPTSFQILSFQLASSFFIRVAFDLCTKRDRDDPLKAEPELLGVN